MLSLRFPGLLLLPLLLAAAETRTPELARRILDAGLDPEECYRVRDLNFARQDIRFYLGDGYLIFGKPVDGLRTSAVFTAGVEGGDGEVLLFPPDRAERLSLASYIGAPNLDERFQSAVFIFTDDTYARLTERIRARDPVRRSSERGQLLAESWNPVVRNFGASFQIRLVEDVLSGSPPANGFYYAALAGGKLGNFDVLYDPEADEQITMGQMASRDNRTFFDVWTRFRARSFRTHRRAAASSGVTLSDFRIDATLEPDLRLRVLTKAKLTADAERKRALVFYISRQMRVNEVTIDGAPAEVFQPESLRATLIRGGRNEAFLVYPASALEPGRSCEIEFRHEGAVVSDAGNGVYYVGARGSWYPNRDMLFTRYDLTFRYPKALKLVATGEIAEDRTAGEWQVTRRKSDAPIRMAGFNLGDYQRDVVKRGGYTVEVYANRRLERALEPAPQLILLPPPSPATGWPRLSRRTEVMPIPPPQPPKPAGRAEEIASDVSDGLEFMASHFGPLPLKTLTVSPIPGAFGQGFPGLIYLSTLSYLEPQARPGAGRDPIRNFFFSEILSVHETAHQWWGNLVTTMSYQDEWLMEALANYSALLWLEKKKGERALDAVLAEYRTHLLAKAPGGRRVESAGPIIWGARLENSLVPGAWRTIIYEKGSWIMHMLRRRLGDERYLKALGELRRRYQYKGITTEEFRLLAAEFLPPGSPDRQLESFFDQWVYGTGIPELKLKYAVRGKPPKVRVTGTVTQSESDEDFSVYVPVEMQFARGKPVVEWVRTVNGPVSFSVAVSQRPTRVLLDPSNGVLRQ